MDHYTDQPTKAPADQPPYASTHDAALAEFADRHPGTLQVLRHFRYVQLPPHLREISEACCGLAIVMVRRLPDGPELTTGLRKLLEGKDCFVRAAL